MSNSLKPTERFSSRVADYARYRPDYPREIPGILHDKIGFSSDWLIADVGCGTGISSRLFLDSGNEVFGVEPNDDMRAAAEAQFANQPRFHPLKGSGEATNLPDRAIDLILVAQAFHWFDPSKAATEFKRILRPGKGGYVLLMWNQRLVNSPFAIEYDELMNRYGDHYKDVANRWAVSSEEFSRVFGTPFQRIALPNEQRFDLAGLNGRAGSSSYVPLPGQPGHVEMFAGLKELFEKHQQGGIVRFEYDTELFTGRIVF